MSGGGGGGFVAYGALSDFGEKALLRHMFRIAAYPQPSGLWIALYNTFPTETAPGVEPPQVAAYARVQATFVDAPQQSDGSSAIWNDVLLQWQVAEQPWGTIVACGVHDDALAGNLLIGGALTVQKFVDYGDAVRFSPYSLLIGLQ